MSDNTYPVIDSDLPDGFDPDDLDAEETRA